MAGFNGAFTLRKSARASFLPLTPHSSSKDFQNFNTSSVQSPHVSPVTPCSRSIRRRYTPYLLRVKCTSTTWRPSCRRAHSAARASRLRHRGSAAVSISNRRQFLCSTHLHDRRQSHVACLCNCALPGCRTSQLEILTPLVLCIHLFAWIVPCTATERQSQPFLGCLQ